MRRPWARATLCGRPLLITAVSSDQAHGGTVGQRAVSGPYGIEAAASRNAGAILVPLLAVCRRRRGRAERLNSPEEVSPA